MNIVMILAAVALPAFFIVAFLYMLYLIKGVD
jgi:hypothetical protein